MGYERSLIFRYHHERISHKRSFYDFCDLQVQVFIFREKLFRWDSCFIALEYIFFVRFRNKIKREEEITHHSAKMLGSSSS